MKKQTKSVIAGVLMIAAGLASGYFAHNAFQKGIDMVGYAVPKAEIAPYTVLSAELFTTRELPRALAATGAEYCADIRQLEGRMTTSRLVASLPVACAVISESQDYRLADPSLEVVSFSIPAESAVGGEIEAGANINIYLVRTYQTDGAAGASRSDSTLIATVPVIKMITPPTLSVDGEDSVIGNDSIIVVVAGSGQTIQNILSAITKAEADSGAYIWTTLAAAESSAAPAGTTVVVDPSQSTQGLGISQGDARATFEGLGITFGSEQQNPDGITVMVGNRDEIVSVVLSGPAENLSKVEIKSSAEGTGANALENSVYMIGFAKFAFPEWAGSTDWIRNQFAISVAGSGAETTYGGATISMSERDPDGFVTLSVLR